MLNKIDRYCDLTLEILIMVVVLLIPGSLIWITGTVMIAGVIGICEGVMLISLLIMCEIIMICYQLTRIIEEVIILKEAREH